MFGHLTMKHKPPSNTFGVWGESADFGPHPEAGLYMIDAGCMRTIRFLYNLVASYLQGELDTSQKGKPELMHLYKG